MNRLLTANDARIKQALIEAGIFAAEDLDRLERQAT